MKGFCIIFTIFEVPIFTNLFKQKILILIKLFNYENKTNTYHIFYNDFWLEPM